MSNSRNQSAIERWLLKKLHSSVGGASIQLTLEGNGERPPTRSTASANVVIRDSRTLAKLILNPEIGFGDAYSEGRIEVEGDLVNLLENVNRSSSVGDSDSWYSGLVSLWQALTQNNTPRGSRKNIHHHYDLRTDFYKLWLDPALVYTCAYFPSPSATLEEAQLAKLDHVCRKLQLRPGESVVEAGCGWGGLALHMAKHYGVTVRAFNISREQILFARQRAKEEKLNRQVEFIEDDYRNISGSFDVFVSVGMLEHVGAKHYGDLGRVIDRSLTKSGRGLLHFIGRNRPRPFSSWTRKRIFPGAYAPALSQVMPMFESWDFSVLDVENLRLHYAKTLEHWLERFEKAARRVSEMFDPKFVRAWRLYLSGSLAAFRTGTLQLFQIVFARPDCEQIPWTREHLYTEDLPSRQEPKWIRAIS